MREIARERMGKREWERKSERGAGLNAQAGNSMESHSNKRDGLDFFGGN